MVKNIAKAEVGQFVFPMFAESEVAATTAKIWLGFFERICCMKPVE